MHIALREGFDILNDKGQQAREITVLDRGNERAVLAERTGKYHGQLRVLDDGRFFAAGTGDSLVFGSFTKGGVVVRGRTTPDVGDDRTFGLMDIPASVLLRERPIESRVSGIPRDDERMCLMNPLHEIEGEVGDSFAASRRTDDEELEVGVVPFGGNTVPAIEVRHTRAGGGKQGHQQHVFFTLAGTLHPDENRCGDLSQG